MVKTGSPHVQPHTTACPRHQLPPPTLGDKFVVAAEAAEDVAPAPARYHLLKNYKEVVKLLELRFQSPEEKSRNATHLPVLPMLRGGHSPASEQEQPASCFYFPPIFSAIPAPPRLTSTWFSEGWNPAGICSPVRWLQNRKSCILFLFSTPNVCS